MTEDTQMIGDVLEEWVRYTIADHNSIPLLGLSGSQGIGKTTALRQLADASGLNVAALSLDDFYLRRSARNRLAQTIHPLCATRGAPGTHDIKLLCSTIKALQSQDEAGVAHWPKFDKITDDRSSDENEFTGRPDAFLVEGWLIGALSDPDAGQDQPVNELEGKEDAAGRWRTWQEHALSNHYEPLWKQFDGFLYLCAPSFATVLDWRSEQEETTLGLAKGSLPQDRQEWVERFVQHYERITNRILSGFRMPGAEVRVNEKRMPMKNDLRINR
ncbi:MAG: hypothetical protein JJ850_02950 [Kordiimonadaceae bacterium]|nr:hypothetical protein [Kordiimonadaceae bacterium]MBO6963552.1 hypothetical protein [Kordiimonadaceae bacterium]